MNVENVLFNNGKSRSIINTIGLIRGSSSMFDVCLASCGAEALRNRRFFIRRRVLA